MLVRAGLTLGLLSTTLLAPFPGRAASQLQEPGTIEGTLTRGPAPTKRWASRYAAGGSPVHGLQHVAAVAFLIGDVGPARRSRAIVEMVQRDTVFDPGALAIVAGTTVRFPNSDPFFHNVFSFGSSPRFDLGRYPFGVSREVRFDTPGIVRIYCEIHEFMRAIVVVTEHGFHAVVDPNGRFRLEGVPPGSYNLGVYQPDLGLLETQVVVLSGQTTNAEVGPGG